MTAGRIVRLVALAGLLGLASGCDLLLGIPDLGHPGNVTSMKARFKAIIQAEADSPAPLDWGVAGDCIWLHHMGPRSVAFCECPVDAPTRQRSYQVNFFQDTFGSIEPTGIETPAHPPGNPPGGPCLRALFDPR